MSEIKCSNLRKRSLFLRSIVSERLAHKVTDERLLQQRVIKIDDMTLLGITDILAAVASPPCPLGALWWAYF